jgi:hypothetical protein
MGQGEEALSQQFRLTLCLATPTFRNAAIISGHLVAGWDHKSRIVQHGFGHPSSGAWEANPILYFLFSIFYSLFLVFDDALAGSAGCAAIGESLFSIFYLTIRYWHSSCWSLEFSSAPLALPFWSTSCSQMTPTDE